MQEITAISLGLTSALLYGVAYFIYAKSAYNGKTTPNTAAWIVWTIFAILNAITYQAISGDVLSNLQFIASSIACVVTFLFMIKIGSFRPLKKFEWGVLMTIGFSLLFWYFSGSAVVANFTLLVGFCISMLPVYVDVFNNPNSESPTPWVMWMVATVCTIIALLIRSAEFIMLVTPGTLILSYLLVLLVREYKRERLFIHRFIK